MFCLMKKTSGSRSKGRKRNHSQKNKIQLKETTERSSRKSRTPRPRQLKLIREKCADLLKEIEEKKQIHVGIKEKLDTLSYTLHNTDYETFESSLPGKKQTEMLNIVVVAAECAPYSKTGGLGDVVGSLPRALRAFGHRVMVVTPMYDDCPGATSTGVRMRYHVFGSTQEVEYHHLERKGVDVVFVSHPSYRSRGRDIYGGSRLDVAFRCALLSKAALETPWHVPCGGTTYGESNLVFVANDWHTALLPVYLRAHYQDYGKLSEARSIFVIHNVAFQGRGPLEELHKFEIPEKYFADFHLYDPIGGEHMNLMKAAFVYAQRIVAVSEGYAWECQTREGGWGLDSVLREHSWKLSGIVNGIDTEEWNPETDFYLQTDGYENYSISSLDKKAKCKRALQKELGLAENPSTPLIGFIGRLTYQKGIDLIRQNFDWLISQDVQLVLLGSGSPELEEALRAMEAAGDGKCRGWVGFSVKMAHRITAGSDILLMPSRFEPCGLNQLYAFAYGTVPVVHSVGGLRDTVINFDPWSNTGNGWAFDNADRASLQKAIHNALVTFREYPDTFKEIMLRGMKQDLSWERSAVKYLEVLNESRGQW